MSEPLYRHDLENPNVTFHLADPPPGWIEALEAHLDKHLGKCLGVFHEIISTNVHLDLYFFEASQTRPFRTVVTVGVSNAPQNIPAGAEEYRHVELMCYVPADWPMDVSKLPEAQRDKFFWPMRMLKDVGRMVHMYNTCVLPGHTMSRSGEASPAYYPGCTQNCTLVLPPFKEPKEFDTLAIGGTSVRFLQIFPITDAETKFKAEHGMAPLLDQINTAGTESLVINPERKCSCEHQIENKLAVVITASLQETRGIYLRLRNNLDEQTKQALRITPPDWVAETNSPLMCLYRDQQLLLAEGRLVWAYIIQANVLLKVPGGPNCPAAVVFGDSDAMDSQLERLSQIASTLGETKGNKECDPELKRFSELITGETEVCLNLKVPRSHSDGLDVFYTTIMVHREQLPAPVLSAPFLPLLVCPEKTQATMILPVMFWSEMLKKVFTLSLNKKGAASQEEDSTVKRPPAPAAKNVRSAPAPVRAKPVPLIVHQEEPSSGCMAKLGGTLALMILMGFVRMGMRSATSTPPSRPTTNYNRPAIPDDPFAASPNFSPSPAQPNSQYALHANESVALDRYLGLRASMLTGNASGILINQTGYKFEPALTQFFEKNPKAAVPRFVFYAMLKFARPIKARIKSNVHQLGMEDYYKPLETLGSETIERESPLGRAFTTVLIQSANAAGWDFQNEDTYTATKVHAWWQKHAAEFDRCEPLESFLQDSWTRQYVLPKLATRTAPPAENVLTPKAAPAEAAERVMPKKVQEPNVVKSESVRPQPSAPEPVKTAPAAVPESVKPVPAAIPEPIKPAPVVVHEPVKPALAPVTENSPLASRLYALLPILKSNYGYGPWNWPDFERLDKPALAAAFKEIEAKAPVEDPAVRLWVAGCHLSFGVNGAEQEFSDALERLKNDAPLKFNSTQQRLLSRMAQAGVKQVLPLIAAQAEREFALMLRVTAQRGNGDDYYPPAMRTLHSLLGWQEIAPGKNGQSEIGRVKNWVADNLADMAWNKERGIYVCKAPPPGMDDIYAAAKIVETAYGIKSLDLTKPVVDSTPKLRSLLAAVREKPDAGAEAKKAACDMVQIILEKRVATEIQMHADKTQGPILLELSSILPDIPSRVLKVMLDTRLPNDPDQVFTGYFREGTWSNQLAAACAILRPQYEQTLKDVLQSENIDAKMQAAMAVLFTGGKVEFADFKPMNETAPREWIRWEGKLEQWNKLMNVMGRTGALRLALLRGMCQDRIFGKDLLKDFNAMCRWEENPEPNLPYPQLRKERLAVAWEWMNVNEERLHFDSAKNAFVGAVSPDKAEVYEAMQHVPEKFGLKVDDVLALGGATLVAPNVLTLLEQNGDARNDPACQELLTALLRYILKDRKFGERVRNLLPLIPQEAAAGVVATEIELSFDNIFKRKGMIFELLDLQQRVDRKLFDAGRALLLPSYEKKFNAAKPDDVLTALLQYLYCGGTIDPKKLDDMIKSAPQSEKNRLPFWVGSTQGAGYVDSLGMTLGLARHYGKDRSRYFEEFESFLGTRKAGPLRTPSDEELDAIFAWYVKYKDKLVWNEKNHRFAVPNGVPEPPTQPGQDQPEKTANPVKTPAPPSAVNK